MIKSLYSIGVGFRTRSVWSALMLAGVGLAWLATGNLYARAAGAPATVSFTTAEQFEACQRDVNLAVQPGQGAVVLAASEAVSTEMGNKITKTALTPKQAAKKVFYLDTVGADKGEIYIFGEASSATLNGLPLRFEPVRAEGWAVASFDGKRLNQGKNEVVFPAGSRLSIDKEARGGASFASADAGRSWAPVSGEFLVHLRLARHPGRGVMTSDVIDLANPTQANVICPSIQVGKVTVAPTADAPAGTSVEIKARTGDTLRPDETWSQWSDAQHAELKPARYVQWQAVLRTTDRTQTPTLKAVTVRAQTTVLSDPSTQGLKVTGFENQKIVRSSYPFTWQTPSAKLDRLRQQFHLDGVIASGKTDFDKFILLRNWVRHQWTHNDGGSGKRTWDALEILSAGKGEHGMCVHFGVAFTQCALALGFPARQLVLQHHYVSEIWSNEHRKWVLMDVEAVQPEGWDRYGTAYYVDRTTHQPMSGLDLHQALLHGRAADIVQMYDMTDAKDQFQVNERHYGPEGFAVFHTLAYPQRNDFLDHLTPWEEFHGEDNYHSNLYLWWRDDLDPSLQYTDQTNRAGDLAWTLNQAAVTVTATAKPESVVVALDTVTPNFKAFAYRIDGGKWQTLAGSGGDAHDRQASLSWSLRSGSNRIEVKPVNAFDRDGIVSTVVIERTAGPAK